MIYLASPSVASEDAAANDDIEILSRRRLRADRS
jgi:hypothetical protein